MRRDMSRREFDVACDRHGIRPGLFGYYDIGDGVLVYARNGGPGRRHQLKYLLSEQARWEREKET